MKIISKFKDYYDSVQGYMFNPKVLYIRKPAEQVYTKLCADIADKISLSQKYVWQTNVCDNHGNCFSLSISIIGFCGKLYAAYRVTDESNYYTAYSSFDMKRIIKRLKKENPGEHVIDHLEKVGKSLDSIKQGVELLYPFIDIDAPIFKITDIKISYSYVEKYKVNSGKITKNCSLKQYDFYKILSPFETYQEIEMFLNNELVSSNELIQISDKDMKIKKGFGHKYAFKKEPEKR